MLVLPAGFFGTSDRSRLVPSFSPKSNMSLLPRALLLSECWFGLCTSMSSKSCRMDSAKGAVTWRSTLKHVSKFVKRFAMLDEIRLLARATLAACCKP